MSDALSDPLLGAALLLALAGLILVLGLAMQASANGSRRRSSWQEMADGHRRDEGPEVTQPPVAPAPVTQPPVAEPPVAPAPVTQPRVTQPRVTQPPVAPAQEPIKNNQPPGGQRRKEELAGANGSDGGWTRIEAPRDVVSENGVQDKDRDRRWMEELIARADAIEESCGRADEASARVTRLIVPPSRSDN